MFFFRVILDSRNGLQIELRESLADLSNLIGLCLSVFLRLKIQKNRDASTNKNTMAAFSAQLPARSPEESHHVIKTVAVILGRIEKSCPDFFKIRHTGTIPKICYSVKICE